MHNPSRRELLSGITGLALQLGLKRKLNAAELSGFYYRDYSKCLPDYLSGLASEAYHKRNRELSLLTNSKTIKLRQTWARETFWKLVGGQPERTPLNARVTGHFERESYRLEKVVYEGQPGVFITANLYIPIGHNAPHPGVLFQMGHSDRGKAYDSYQKCCQGLARLGYLVLAFDPMGQGERINYPDASGNNTRLSSVDDEHDRPGKQFLLLGNSATRYQLWDAIRSLDYLAAHPLVDPNRLASTGQSGGATVLMFLACADDRLSAAAICSGNTENLACANFQAPGSTDDAEQDLIGSGTAAFDRWDLLYPMAPKPLLIQVSAHDFFGTYSPRYLDNGREEYKKLAQVYAVLGHSDQLGWNSTPMTHGLTYSFRLDIYNWFERWLMKSGRTITAEPAVSPEADKTLWVGETGNVVRDFGSLRPFDWVKQNAAAVNRGKSSTSWQKVLPARRPPANLKVRWLNRVSLGDVVFAAAEVNTEAGVWIPVWVFSPAFNAMAKPDSVRQPLLVLDDHGRNAGAKEDGLYHRMARGGRTVYAADIRGMGDSRPQAGPGNPAYTIDHDSEEEFAWASLILGESLLSQRIHDILCLQQAILNEQPTGAKQVAIAARGHLTVPALFALASSENASALYLANGLASYQSLLAAEDYQHPLANFAWDLFRSTDLPLLAAAAAPKRIHIAGAVNGMNSRMDIEEVRRLYSTGEAQGTNVQISAEADWNETVLAAV